MLSEIHDKDNTINLKEYFLFCQGKMVRVPYTITVIKEKHSLAISPHYFLSSTTSL